MQNVPGNDLAKAIPHSIDRLLNSKIPFDAIFFATDTLTINGLKYLNKKQIKVPDKISVLSFDESEAFELHYCPITHSRQPLEEIGKLAVTTLVNLIKHEKAVNHISLQAEIILGKSCREK